MSEQIMARFAYTIMAYQRPHVSDIKSEVILTTSRSGGPGGQHVNKVETKVQLRWNITTSQKLSDYQKQILLVAAKSKMSQDGDLVLSCDSKRSQVRNKEIVFKKLDRLLAKAFAPKKKRKPTTPTKAAKRKRLSDKKRQSEKKELRKRII